MSMSLFPANLFQGSSEQFLFITCRVLVRAHAIIDNVDLIKPRRARENDFFSINEPVGHFNIPRSHYTFLPDCLEVSEFLFAIFIAPPPCQSIAVITKESMINDHPHLISGRRYPFSIGNLNEIFGQLQVPTTGEIRSNEFLTGPAH